MLIMWSYISHFVFMNLPCEPFYTDEFALITLTNTLAVKHSATINESVTRFMCN